ncbi:MAG: ankyrin repeat domain-containing protein [bacterium]
MAGVFAIGINIAEGSEEGRDLGELTKVPLSTLQMLSESEAQIACKIVNLCRRLIFPTIQGEIISAEARFNKEIKAKLSGKKDRRFEFKYTCNGEKRVRITSLNEEGVLISKCQKFIVQLMRDQGRFPVNAQDFFGVAISFNKPEFLRMALEMGACVSNRLCLEGYGEALPLTFAIFKSEGKPDCVQILLDFGAKPNKMENGKQTPLAAAILNKYSNIVKLLLDKKADPNMQCLEDQTPLCVAIDVDAPEIVEMLLSHGADPRRVSKQSKIPPVFQAILENKVNIVEILLKHGVGVNIRGKAQITPLLFAIDEREEEIIDLLLNRGANIFACDSEGANCVGIARDGGHEALAEYLQKRREASADEIISIFRDPGKKEQQDLEIERLEQAHPLEQEDMLILLMQRGAEITWFPSKFLTKRVIAIWLTTSKRCGHLPNYKKFPEDYQKKIDEFFEACKRSLETKEAPTKETSKERVEYKGPEVLTPNPQEGRVFGYKPREEKKKDVLDTTTPEEVATECNGREKSTKSLFNTPYETIFQWDPTHSAKLAGHDFDKLISATRSLCESLTTMGFSCSFILRKGHYRLIVGRYPDDVKEAKKWNLPNSIPVNSIYTDFFNDVASYLMHVVCLLALKENPGAVPMLSAFIAEGNLDKDQILRIYPGLAPYLTPSK